MAGVLPGRLINDIVDTFELTIEEQSTYKENLALRCAVIHEIHSFLTFRSLELVSIFALAFRKRRNFSDGPQTVDYREI